MESGEEYFSSSSDGGKGRRRIEGGKRPLRDLLISRGNYVNQDANTPGKVIFQHNMEELHRQELGGVVVYDSFARIIGNHHVTSYYEKHPPKRTDFNLLFSAQE